MTTLFQTSIEHLLRTHNLLESFQTEETFHVRFEKAGYQPLVIERHGEMISVAHYFKQNGDLVANPDVELHYPSWVPTAITQAYFGYRTKFIERDGKTYVDTRFHKQVSEFLTIWARNIKAQNWAGGGPGCIMTTSPNIRFAYMYRDASNYKQHGEVIFSNEKQLSMDEIDKQIRSFMSDGEYFIARQAHLEECFFDVLYDDDHPWHEFVRVEATDNPTFDPEYEHKRDIAEFLGELENAHRAGWDEMNVREDLARQFTEQKRALKQRLESGGKMLRLSLLADNPSANPTPLPGDDCLTHSHLHL